MNPDMDEDILSLLRDTADNALRPDPAAVRVTRDAHDAFDAILWRQFADLGWLGIVAPEYLGGTGLDITAAAVIAERLGFACRSEPFSIVAVLSMSSLTACPAGAERDRLIADIAAGRILATTAWQPATGATSTASTPVEAYRHDNHYHLSGDCYFVAVPQAEFILAAAKLDGVTELFAIRRGPGTALGLNWLADGSQAAKVHFETDIPLAARLSAGVDMSSALDDAVDAATLSTSAEILGVMERSLTLTRDYISTRRQFGRAIGTFQTLQHQLVDMWIQVQLTRAALTGALSRFRASDTTRPDRASAASSAKARASQAALFVAERAIQLHGAIGMTDEYELGVYVNRALVLASQFGNATAHRRRYSELVALEERQL